MKKKVLFISAAAAAAGAAALLLIRKKGDAAPAAGESAKSEPQEAVKNQAQGTYSFVSGFKDAATVDVKVAYDPHRFEFAVVEEEFLCPTSDSHAAILSGTDFDAQIEYAPFYAGDNFEKLRDNAKSSPGYAEFSGGFRYVAGDSIYNCMPVDEYTYLLITVMLADDSELKFEELPDAPELEAILSGIEIVLKK